MRSYLICELKRKIISSEFLISVIAFIAVGLLNAYFNIYSTNKVGIGGLTLFIHSTVLGYSLFSYVAPIIGALPVCSKIVDSIASGYINQELARVPKRTYINIQIISSSITGASVLGISCIAYLIVCIIVEPTAAIRLLPMRYISSYNTIYAKSLFGFCIIIIINSMLFGVSYALFSLGIAYKIRNKIAVLTIITAFYVGATFLNRINICGMPILPCGSFVMLVSEIATAKDHILTSILGIVLFNRNFYTLRNV